VASSLVVSRGGDFDFCGEKGEAEKGMQGLYFNLGYCSGIAGQLCKKKTIAG
jgi:hypothetical protein